MKDILSRREASGVLKGALRSGAPLVGRLKLAEKHLTGSDLAQVQALRHRLAKGGYGSSVGKSEVVKNIAAAKIADRVLREKLGSSGSIMERGTAKYSPRTIYKKEVREIGQKGTAGSDTALSEQRKREEEQRRGADMAKELAEQRNKAELLKKRNIGYLQSQRIEEEGRLESQAGIKLSSGESGEQP